MTDGKICYLEIPAADVDTSSRFYAAAFGWKLRARGDGERAFDDSTGAVSGSWVVGRPPAREAGLLPYVLVDSIDATLTKIAASGGRTATPRTPLSPAGDAYATFFDPYGNLMGLYEAPRR